MHCELFGPPKKKSSLLFRSRPCLARNRGTGHLASFSNLGDVVVGVHLCKVRQVCQVCQVWCRVIHPSIPNSTPSFNYPSSTFDVDSAFPRCGESQFQAHGEKGLLRDAYPWMSILRILLDLLKDFFSSFLFVVGAGACSLTFLSLSLFVIVAELQKLLQ